MDMMILTSEIFERLSFLKLVIITSVVLGFYWILTEYIARVFMSWESVAVMVVVTISTVLLSGWSFVYGLTLDCDPSASDAVK